MIRSMFVAAVILVLFTTPVAVSIDPGIAASELTPPRDTMGSVDALGSDISQGTQWSSSTSEGGVAQTVPESSDASSRDAEPNDSMASATPIEYGQEVEANLSSPSDVDYYALNATAGDAIITHLHLRNMFGGSAIQVDLVTPSGEVTTELTNDLMSGPQNSVGAADKLSGSDMAYTGNVMEFNGTYYVRVKEATNLPCCGGPETNESATYRYTLTVNRTSVDEYEPNENGTTATPVELDETVNAAFAGYDSDVYALNLTAGQNYTVTLEHMYQDNSHAHTMIWVYANESQPVDDPVWPHTEDNSSPYHRDPNGTTVATSGTIYRMGTLSFTPEANKTYYVQIMQSRENGNLLDLDQYELAVNRTDGDAEDPNDRAECPTG